MKNPFAEKAGDLLPPCDFAGVLLAGYLSLLACGTPWRELSTLVWVAAAIAPFLLYGRGFAGRLLMFAGVTSAIALAGHWLDRAPAQWLALWLGGVGLLTASSRLWLARRPGDAPEPAPPVGYVCDVLPVHLLADRPIRRWNAVLKSLEDSVLGTLMTVMLLPVLAGIALAIKLDSRGPVLFRQRRHGLNNREFDIYKFRTMRCEADAPGAALKQTVRGDDRITRVGHFLRRFSLDELPQVFNVLRGDMSLVGPRPHAVNMRTEDRLGHELIDVYPHRHRVKPGISGWSQVNGYRGATHTVAQLRGRIELDLHYVENWSLLLDLRILALTCREVVRATNAY